MDRRFLSQTEVIAASRRFVCVRLLTYEDRHEADFLKQLFVGRSGELENTTFVVLSPDGRQQLLRAGRAPPGNQGAVALAETLNRLAAQYPPRKADGDPLLPRIASVRLALDVAACDNRPLAVVHAADAVALQQLEERLRPLAWSDDLLGRLVYASTTDARHLQAIEGVAPSSGLLVIQPDRYGVKGKVLSQTTAKAPVLDWRRTLQEGIAAYQPTDKTFPQHIRDGQRAGIFWDTVLPVTDPLEKRAREKR
ncbi:MAG: hypothetical protein JNM56_19110 [Planctomycetia bacterium]|nr:hypothetical protein [Planctomycetia bacterium]